MLLTDIFGNIILKPMHAVMPVDRTAAASQIPGHAGMTLWMFIIDDDLLTNYKTRWHLGRDFRRIIAREECGDFGRTRRHKISDIRHGRRTIRIAKLVAGHQATAQ